MRGIIPSRATTLLTLSALPFAAAGPYPRDNIHDAGYGYLFQRDCASYCGANNQYCCESNQICTTQNDVATCIYAQVGVDVYTTTWTETRVYTKTISSTYQLVTTEAVIEQCVPASGSGQTACGSVCCGSWQTCAWEGQCLDRSSGIGGVVYTTTISGVVTTGFSAPYRPTSGATSTTTTVASTGTAIGGAAGAEGGSGLSGGAIAGIVIGVIAGVILLLLLCACFLVRGLWSGIMGIFGGKDDRRRLSREKVVIEEERYVRHGSASASRRQGHGSWYGDRPSAAAERKKEGGKGLLGMAAGLGTLALLLGLKKKDDKPKPARSRSSYSSSYFTDSYTGVSPSSASTRRTRQTRGSRTTRHTRSTRRSSRRSSRR